MDLVRNLTLAVSGRGQHGGTCGLLSVNGGRGTRPLKGMVRLIIHSVASECGTPIFAGNTIVKIDPLG